MAIAVALFGAAGRTGAGIARRLRAHPQYRLVHPDAAGPADASPDPLASDVGRALAEADVAILAVPDAQVGALGATVVPALRPGTLVVCLDAAAPMAGALTLRPDLAYFATHPTHPPLFGDEPEAAARRDFFGGTAARQSVVCALIQGNEADYMRGEALARLAFAPILRCHRITLEQMAILEPTLVETVAATCVDVMREALDEAVGRGVPASAARDFLLGHLRIELAMAFGETDGQLTAGAKRAVAEGRKALLRPDWKRVFEREDLLTTLRAMAAEPGS